jgi:hypothetical protein
MLKAIYVIEVKNRVNMSKFINTFLHSISSVINGAVIDINEHVIEQAVNTYVAYLLYSNSSFNMFDKKVPFPDTGLPSNFQITESAGVVKPRKLDTYFMFLLEGKPIALKYGPTVGWRGEELCWKDIDNAKDLLSILHNHLTPIHYDIKFFVLFLVVRLDQDFVSIWIDSVAIDTGKINVKSPCYKLLRIRQLELKVKDYSFKLNELESRLSFFIR